jgi:hypothetical protein
MRKGRTNDIITYKLLIVRTEACGHRTRLRDTEEPAYLSVSWLFLQATPSGY